MNKSTYYFKNADERRIYQREYEKRKKEKNPVEYLARVRETVKKWRKQNPLKEKAHKKVFVEMRAGRMKKQPCTICGSKKSEAHHEDYSKPLDVIWFCKMHHRMAHREELNLYTPPLLQTKCK